jgi:REP element-mobilizing transposase RayT
VCDRYWFFTWRTYGTWLPGRAGFVGYYHTDDGRRVIDNIHGEPTTDVIPLLERYAGDIMTGEPVALTRPQADVLFNQLQETAAYREWVIDAVAVLVNHVHVVFGVPGDPDPSEMLGDWKSYASRALNRRFGRPHAPRWWADGGSKEPLRAEHNRVGAVEYVRDQENPLLVWLSDEAKNLVAAVRSGIDAATAASPGG